VQERSVFTSERRLLRIFLLVLRTRNHRRFVRLPAALAARHRIPGILCSRVRIDLAGGDPATPIHIEYVAIPLIVCELTEPFSRLVSSANVNSRLLLGMGRL
jgi:hypothetical protein